MLLGSPPPPAPPPAPLPPWAARLHPRAARLHPRAGSPELVPVPVPELVPVPVLEPVLEPVPEPDSQLAPSPRLGGMGGLVGWFATRRAWVYGGVGWFGRSKMKLITPTGANERNPVSREFRAEGLERCLARCVQVFVT